jgi:hypothetical protein
MAQGAICLVRYPKKEESKMDEFRTPDLDVVLLAVSAIPFLAVAAPADRKRVDYWKAKTG